jgi:hypothetical protein
MPGHTGPVALGALNRLAKWRTLLAGWQLGTRTDTDPEAAAVRDQREALLLLRCEVTTLVGLLLEAGIFTTDQLNEGLIHEAGLMETDLERRYPGVRATDNGLTMDIPVVRGWMRDRGWKS